MEVEIYLPVVLKLVVKLAAPQGNDSVCAGNSLNLSYPARTPAILACLNSTFRRHDVDWQLYLTQMLKRYRRVVSRQIGKSPSQPGIVPKDSCGFLLLRSGIAGIRAY